jgi:hypothetical protein
MFKKRGKSGKLLMENLIFIILNVLFLAILILFLLRQGQGAAFLEQSYSKQIALLIDSAKPGMTIIMDMSKGKDLAEKNGIQFKDIVRIRDNIVTVKLTENSGYSYSFFNDVDVGKPHPDNSDPENVNSYVFVIGHK